MNPEKRLRNAMRAADGIEPAPDSWNRIRETVARRTRRRRIEHVAALILSVAVLSGGGLLGVRALGGDEPGVVLTDPALSSPASSPTPLDTSSPTSSPSPSDDPSMKTFVSDDGTWEVKYPSDWTVEKNTQEPSEWRFLNPEAASPDEAGLTDGEYLIEFLVRENSEKETIDDLLARYCQVDPGADGTVEECRKTQINGRTWAWALQHVEVSGGVRGFLVGSIADGRVYEAVASIPDGSRQNEGLKQVREILGSFVVRE